MHCISTTLQRKVVVTGWIGCQNVYDLLSGLDSLAAALCGSWEVTVWPKHVICPSGVRGYSPIRSYFFAIFGLEMVALLFSLFVFNISFKLHAKKRW